MYSILKPYLQANLISIILLLCFSVAQAQVPNAPTNLVVTPINNGGMIQFTAPTNNGGSAITNYEYAINNGNFWTTPTPANPSSPLIISSSDLVNCTSYTLKLRAVNVYGSGVASSPVTLIPAPAITNATGITWTSRTSAADNSWNSITYGNGLFVAVASTGTGNRVMTSPDGIVWTSRTFAADNNWTSVTYGNGLFVAVASAGTGNQVMTSPDGIVWTSRTSAADNSWTSVTYGNGLFVAVASTGTGNRVMTSPNGITWTLRTYPADNGWMSVTYGNGLFVAVANSGTGNRVMTSTDGISWTTKTSATDNSWGSVTYGNGLFVAVSASGTGNRVMTSPDGTIWTIRTSAADNSWKSVTYGNDLFVAVASNGTGNRVMTSTDGAIWTTRTSVADNSWMSVTYANGLFVAVANSGTGNRVMTSSLSTVADAPLITQAATRNNSVQLSFNQTTSGYAPAVYNYQYSIDNGNWTDRSPASYLSPLTITNLANDTTYSIKIRAINSSGTSCESLPFSATPAFVLGTVPNAPTNLIVTPIDKGGMIQFTDPANNGESAITNYEYSTNNGIDWISPTPANPSSPLIINSSALVNCTSYTVKLRAVNANGSGAESDSKILIPAPAITNVTGISWTARTSAADNVWQSVTYGNGLFVAVASTGVGNRVMTSPDGIIWTSRTSATDNNWSSVTYGNGSFVAVASSGTGNRVMTSPDGINWTSRTSAADNSWSFVTYGNGLFVVVANSGTGNRVMTSPDGINWVTRASALDNNWSSVTYGSGLFVAVAYSGIGNRVMTSPDGINWTLKTSAADNTWQFVTYGNGLFVAVANSGTGNRVMTSPDGIVWTSRTSIPNNSWKSVTYCNGLYVAVSLDGLGNGVMTSPDGINWVTRTSAADNNWYSVTYRNGLFVVVASSGTGNRVMTSSFSPVVDAPVITQAAARNNSVQLSFNQTASGYATAVSNYQYSIDGGNWLDRYPASYLSPLTIPNLVNGTSYSIKIRAINSIGTSCESLPFSATPALGTVPVAPTNLVVTPINTGGMIQFTAPTNDGGSTITNYEYSTNNGNSWTTPTPANSSSPMIISSSDLVNCSNYNVKLRAVNASGTGAESGPVTLIPASSSTLGATWTSRTSAADNYWTSITYGNELFVAVALTGTGNRVMTSPDGITWTSRVSAADNQWSSVTYGNGLFVAVANTGTSNRVMTSPDGINWTSRTSATDNGWSSVTYGNGLFVAVASTGVNRVMTSSDGITWTTRIPAVSNQWTSVTYGTGLFVAVSASGTGNRVMTSLDGINWTSRTSATDNNWNSVTYGNGLFVAVASIGTGNRVMTSSDGIVWKIGTSAVDNSWNSVTYSNGLFVAVASTGTGNRVMASPDGISWTTRTSTADNSWMSVTYANGLFVSVASSGTGNRVMTSSFSTVADVPVITQAAGRNNSVQLSFNQTASAFAPAVSNYQYSIDGGNWIDRFPASYLSPLTIPNLENGTSYSIKIRAINSIGTSCESLPFSATPALGTVPNAPTNLVVTPIDKGGMIQFTALANDGGSAITNYEYAINNSDIWITPSPANPSSPLIISSNDLVNCTSYTLKLRAVNASGSGAASGPVTLIPTSSTDLGVTWTFRTSVADNSWTSVSYGNGLFVAVSNSGTSNRVMTSPDGIVWTSRTSAADNNWSSVTYGNSLFVAVASTGTGNRVMTSPDGIVWTTRTSAADNTWNSITYGNGLFVAVSASGTGNRVMTSPDGINWTTRTSAANNSWYSVTYGGNLFVAVALTGTSNRVMTSPDGISWTSRTSAADNNWTSVTYGSGLFTSVALTGASNRVMTSPDGINWTTRTSAADNGWNSVTYGNGLFVAMGTSSTGNGVMTSSDGINWTSRTSAANINSKSVTYSNGLFVSVASSGTGNRVMTSSFSPVVDAPVITAVDFIDGSSANISFTQTTPSLAPPVSNYQYSINNGIDWIVLSPASTTTPIAISSLTSSTQIQLQALNSTGNSCPSNKKLICTSTTSTETVSACGSYTWHGTVYYESNNTATWTGTNAGGCDNVVTLNLTITPNSINTTTISAWDSYTWNGTTYTATGVYIGTATNCVTEKLNLTITPSSIFTTWTGANSTTWSDPGNWSNNSVPTSTSEVTIAVAANQPLLSADVAINSLTIDSGATLTVPTGFNLTVANSITNSGTMTVKSNANLIQVADVANTGSITVERNSAPIVRLDHTLWSSPVAAQKLFAFSPDTKINRFYTYETSSNSYTNSGLDANSTFAVGKGFAIRAPNNQTALAPEVWTGTYAGIPNNGTKSFTLETTNSGYNLVGNPYPSTINAVDFISANQSIILGTLYFYAHSLSMDANGVFPLNSTNYALWNSLGSTAATHIAGDVHLTPENPSGIIQVGQGFFVKATVPGTITFTNAMRMANNDNQNFRTAVVEKDRLWLNLKTETGTDINQILVGYISGATQDVDRNYDGLSFGNTGSFLSSKIAGENYAIQGRSLPFDSNDTVTLGFNAATTGNYTIALTKSDGLFAGNQDVFLKDNLTETTHNIKESEYKFSSQAGIFDARFSLIYAKTLDVDSKSFTPNSVVIYKEKEWFTIKTNGTLMKEVQVYDLAGRLIFKQSGINASTTVLKGLSQVNEALLVKIMSQENGFVIVKVIN